jgi:hypothetical protein
MTHFTNLRSSSEVGARVTAFRCRAANGSISTGGRLGLSQSQICRFADVNRYVYLMWSAKGTEEFPDLPREGVWLFHGREVTAFFYFGPALNVGVGLLRD